MFPVEDKIDEIRRALAKNRDVVLTAPPGSGKTTCVPPALLDEPWLAGKKIVMLEPRRIAARNCAQFISRKLGEPVGGTVGYQVRLERKVSAKTRLEIVTEGLLTQRLLSDPELSDVGLVVFDEFHERSLACDLSFALALEVRRALRPDLRLLVMSATLDADEVAAHLGDADIVRAEGRMFPVETVYLGETSMTAAISKAVKETDGDILCFLPGEGEIRRVVDAAKERATDWKADLLPLYGALPKEEQDRVFEPSARRKVILATSIAETSVTIEGVSCVIDSGLMRVPRFSPATGMSGLVTLPLTQDRAEQRRGRAGRVRSGVCYRLWTEGAQQSRPRKMMPEILDADLCSLVLTSAAWGALGREDLPWMTPPATSLWDQSVALLKMLEALDETGRLTPKGERMAKLPMHPRLANMCLASVESPQERGTEGATACLAAILEEGSKSRETDIRKVLDEIRETPHRPFSRRIIQLASRFSRLPAARLLDFAAGREGVLLARAYPDRVAKNRGNGTFRMVNGRGAFLSEEDPLSKAPYLVCCELDDRAGDAKVFLGCPIDEAEILELFGDKIVERPFCEWDRRTDSVRCVVRRTLGEMTLKEVRAEGRDRAGDVALALLDGIRIKGVENLPCWTKETLQLKARIDFLNRLCVSEPPRLCAESPWPRIDAETLIPAMEGFVSGMTKWRDLERLDIAAVMDFILSEAGHDRRELDRLAPTRMEVPSGSHMLIHYEGSEPMVEVRLQECFGLMETPKVAGGTVPIVMTLLSPAQRPIQVTKDLAGFWRGAYQLVRKDMRGRYPKHYWPDDPLTAVATRRVRPSKMLMLFAGVALSGFVSAAQADRSVATGTERASADCADAELRLLGRVHAEAFAGADGSVRTILRCQTPEKARLTASKFLTDVSSFGNDAGLFAVGHSVTNAVVVFSPDGAPQLPAGCTASKTNDYPLWFDRFDNRPISMGQGGWGRLATNTLAGMAWSARQNFNLFGANYVRYDSWAAPGVWNHTVNDAIAAYAKKLGVGYLDYPLMAHAENPAWYWNEVPLPYATGKDGAIGPTSFDYFKFAANGSDWPMPKIDRLVDYCNQECARHYARDDHFIAHFGSPEKGLGQAATWPGYAGDGESVTMREIVGWKPGESVDLRGEWLLDDGVNPPRKVDGSDPILLAYARKPDGFSLSRSFALAGDLGRFRYLHVASANWHGRLSSLGVVLVNGRPARDLTVRVPLTGDLESCYDLDGLLREGENEIVLTGMNGPLFFYAFLGDCGRFVYPCADEAKNRAFFELSELAAKKAIEYDENRLRAHCAGDPAGRPQFMMCQTHVGDLSFDILHRYAGYQHDTGQTQGCWAPWCSRYWKTRGDPVSCENGGVPRDVTGLRWMLTRYLMLGNDAVNLLFDPEMFRADGKGEWIESHRAWLGCLGKNDLDRFDICVLRSIRNASRLRDSNPWRFDPSRGVLQAAGRIPGLLDPSDLVHDRPCARVSFIMDAATTIMTPEEAKAVARFIRAGGTFIANEHTGVHSHLKREAWPLFAELGLPAKPVLRGGKAPVDYREFAVGRGRLVCMRSGEWWRTYDDGRKHSLENPARISALGAALDRLGVPRSSGGSQLKGMRNCFAEVWRSKNGLYDLFLLAVMGGTNNVTASPCFHAPGKVRKLVELSAEGHPECPFAQDAENRLTLTDVPLALGESRVYAALRADAGRAPLYWLKSLERRWYAIARPDEVPKPAVAKAAESRFLPLQDGWTHVESGRAVTLGSYVTMGIDDASAQATFVKKFAVPSAWKGRRVTLKFEAQGYTTGITPRATVRLNGREVKRTGVGTFRVMLPDAGEVTLEVAVDGRLGPTARRNVPSGVHGVFYAEASARPKETVALKDFKPDLAGSVRTSFASPKGRVFLATDAAMNSLLLNGVMLKVPPEMERVDITGLLRRDGRTNVLRWWPQCEGNPDWQTPAPKAVPALRLEL